MTSTTTSATAASSIKARFIIDQGAYRRRAPARLLNGRTRGWQIPRGRSRCDSRLDVELARAVHRSPQTTAAFSLSRLSRLSLAQSTPVADPATHAPTSADLERVVKFTREPFLIEGEDRATALAPGSPRRVAFDAALGELDAGAELPSVDWRRSFSLLLGLERLLAEEEPKLVDGTVLSAHQVDALSGTLTALLAEAQRNGNGHSNGYGSNGALADDSIALAPVGIPGEDDDDEDDDEQSEEPLDWSPDAGEDDDQLDEQPEDPNAAKRFWFEHATGAGKTVAALQKKAAKKELPPKSTSAPAKKTSSMSEIVEAPAGFPSYCSLPDVAPREFSSNVHPGRLELIVMLEKKWVNGTTLHYYFFNEDTDGRNFTLLNGRKEWRPWKTSEREKDVVRQAFDVWKNVGIGSNFKEVISRDEAEIRIGFERGDGAWSYVGRDLIDLNIGRNERTMNFGWDITRSAEEIDTAVHEIGHTLGFPHEHQNPIAGIIWDEEAVYAALAQPPNRWDRNKTFHNIIRKISPDSVQGSEWDPNSVMHYPFSPGLIKEPEGYRTQGISPVGGLSARDKTWIKTFYPPLKDSALPKLAPAESVKLSIAPGEQKNFSIGPRCY